MKLLFISKPFVIEPLGIMYLSAAAKQRGHAVKLALTSEDLPLVIEKYRPDVIGYSVMTSDYTFYLSLNNGLRNQFKFLSLFGGPHPTFFPELIDSEGVDVICRGEGELALGELMDGLQNGTDIASIPNLIVRKDNKITSNNVRAFEDIDLIPTPDREILKDIDTVYKGPIKHFMASRGCPFNCSYCFNQQYSVLYQQKGKRVRFRKVESVLSEIREVIETHPETKMVYFQDDTFTINKTWLRDFSIAYSATINMPFHCHVRPNTMDEEMAQILKQAGCYSVHIACESGNDRIRNEILDRGISREQILESARLLKKYEIRFMMQNMIGLPTGSINNDLETLELNIECKPDYAWVSIFNPYPGTRLGKLCQDTGLFSGDYSDLSGSFFDSSKLNFTKEYKNQLANLQKIFAIAVDHPELYSLGLVTVLINADPELNRTIFTKAYNEFRSKCDERLFGFKV